jgi:polysaccharide biosynthesis/export protein
MVNTKTLKLSSHPILALLLLTSTNAVFSTPSYAQAKKTRLIPRTPPQTAPRTSQRTAPRTAPRTSPRTAPARVFQSAAPSSGLLNTNYTLGGGDLIKVNVFEVPEYTGEYQVPPGGAINLPLIGSVPVLGLTTEQAADDIARRYARFLKRPIISVNLLSPRPINVLVSGEVTRPGAYSLSLQGGQVIILAYSIQQLLLRLQMPKVTPSAQILPKFKYAAVWDAVANNLYL